MYGKGSAAAAGTGGAVLAATGANVALWLIAGLGLLLGGALLLRTAAVRRNRG